MASNRRLVEPLKARCLVLEPHRVGSRSTKDYLLGEYQNPLARGEKLERYIAPLKRCEERAYESE